MGKVLFTIQYEILPEKRNDYLDVVRELKTLVKTEGLDTYYVFELKGKPNVFTEAYVFANKQAFEDFDDEQDERVDILMNKLSDMIKEHTTQYSTLYEV